MYNNNHLYRKIQAIQNKAKQRRAHRLNESRDATYNENDYNSHSIKQEFTEEEIKTVKRNIIEKAIIEKRSNKRIWYLKLLITIGLLILIFYWLFL